MKTKLVLWGENAQNERVLIAMELRPESNQVNVHTFPEAIANDEFTDQMMSKWRDGGEVTFPEGYSTITRDLSVAENLLPDDLRVERGDVIQLAQTEWHFVVLSTKLNQAYASELDDLKDRIDRLEKYDRNLWDELKTFWDKVQAQVVEKNLFREHSDALRGTTNQLFEKLKSLRLKLDNEFEERSKDAKSKFFELIEGVEGKMKENFRFQSIFDELKRIQSQAREAVFTKSHRKEVWDKLDLAFKAAKDTRFGTSSAASAATAEGAESTSGGDRLGRRYQGLMEAMQKMQDSIVRDEKELEFQNKRIGQTDGQLEAQLRQAKIKLIEERIRSKKEKLEDMLSTQKELDSKVEAQKVRDEKRKEQDKIEAAKKAAQEKIAEQIGSGQPVLDEETAAKLEKAAEQINESKPKKAGILATLGDVVQDMADNVQAAVSVAGDKLQDVYEVAKDKTEDLIADTKEATAPMFTAAMEKADQLMDKAKDLADKARDKAEDIAEKVEDKAEALADKVEDKAEALLETDKPAEEPLSVAAATDAVEEEKSESFLDKAKAFAAAAMDKAGDLMEQAQEAAAPVLEKLEDKAEKWMDKAEDLADAAEDKIEDAVDSVKEKLSGEKEEEEK